MANPRGEYAKTPLKRQRILDAAVLAFGRRGSRGSSLREIADQVGMSQAGLLHHFGSKDRLLLAVLERFEREEQPERPLHTLEDAIAYVRGALQRGLARPGLFQLQVTLSAEATDPDHPTHDHFVERYQRVGGQFRATLEEAVATGRLREDVDPDALAHLIVAAMDGLQLQHLLDDRVDVLAPFDLLLEALVGTFGAEGRPQE